MAGDNGKSRLMAAARQVFHRSSMADASVARILDAAGVQAPTLYHHFGDKEGLYVAWATAVLAELGAQLQSAVSRDERTHTALEAFARVLLDQASPDLSQILRDASRLVQPGNGETVANAYFTAVYEPLCAIFVRGLERGEVRPDNIGRLADAYIGGCYGLGPLFGRSVGSPSEAARWWASRFA